MKKMPLALLVALTLSYSAVTQAQTLAQPGDAAAIQGSLEQRYAQCIGSALCPLHDRLLLVQEETNQMNTRFQTVFERCAAKNFQGCIDAQRGEMEAWHSAEYRAGQMMLSIEAQSLALKESAAGTVAVKTADRKKSIWERLWGK